MRCVYGRAMLLAALVAAGATAAVAGDGVYRAAGGQALQAPVKDCTRFNGRWGYYGNPWCTPAEQARFDRWSARRR